MRPPGCSPLAGKGTISGKDLGGAKSPPPSFLAQKALIPDTHQGLPRVIFQAPPPPALEPFPSSKHCGGDTFSRRDRPSEPQHFPIIPGGGTAPPSHPLPVPPGPLEEVARQVPSSILNLALGACTGLCSPPDPTPRLRTPGRGARRRTVSAGGSDSKGKIKREM